MDPETCDHEWEYRLGDAMSERECLACGLLQTRDEYAAEPVWEDEE